MTIRKLKIIISALLLSLTLTTPLLAQTPPTTGWQEKTYNLLVPIPGETGEELSENVSFENYLKAIYKLSISIAIVLAVLMISIGGLKYITTQSESGKSSARNDITMALIGLFLALSSWLIIATILGQGIFSW